MSVSSKELYNFYLKLMLKGLLIEVEECPDDGSLFSEAHGSKSWKRWL
jgi:hypothetical protein